MKKIVTVGFVLVAAAQEVSLPASEALRVADAALERKVDHRNYGPRERDRDLRAAYLALEAERARLHADMISEGTIDAEAAVRAARDRLAIAQARHLLLHSYYALGHVSADRPRSDEEIKYLQEMAELYRLHSEHVEGVLHAAEGRPKADPIPAPAEAVKP